MAGDEDSLNKVTDDVAKLAEEQRRSAEEAAKMQETLKNIEKFMASMVANQNSSVPTQPPQPHSLPASGVILPEAISNSVQDNLRVAANPSPVTTNQEAGTVGQGLSGASVRVSTTQHKLNTPKMTDGMTFKEYKGLVDIWQLMVDTPEEKQALLLLFELPQKDNHGGLQNIVKETVGMQNLAKPEGVQKLLACLKEILESPTFLRLMEWIDKADNFQQKNGWTIQKTITEWKMLKNEALNEFNINLVGPLAAGKLLKACRNSIPADQLAMITAPYNLESTTIETDIENCIRKYAQTVSANSKVKGVHLCNLDVNGDKKRDLEDTNDSDDEVGFTSGPAKKKAKGKFKKDKKEFDKKRKEASDKGGCTYCFKLEHKVAECIDRKNYFENLRKKTLASGKPWRLRDGRWLYPDGHIFDPITKTVTKCDDPVSINNVQEVEISRIHKTAKVLDIDPRDCLFEGDLQTGVITGAYYTSELPPMPTKEEENVYDIKHVTDELREIFFTADNMENKAILDTGCAKSVAGKTWTERFLNSILEEDKKYIVITKSNARFRFGDGVIHGSSRRIIAPVYFGSVRKFIAFDQVEADISLLISWPAMIKLDITIKAKLLLAMTPGDNKFKITYLKGHPWVSVTKNESKNDVMDTALAKIMFTCVDNSSKKQPSDEENLCSVEESCGICNDILTIEASNTSDVRLAEEIVINEILKVMMESKVFDKDKIANQLKSLHIHMACPPQERFIVTLKTAKVYRSEMETVIDDIYQECLSKDCKARRETQYVPKTCFKVPTHIGQRVAADLKIRTGKGKRDVLWIVDLATGFARSTIINNKTPEEVSKKLISAWYGAGYPRIEELITDNGPEFTDQPFTQLLQRLNIKHTVTSGYTPEQNGVCERIHGICDQNQIRISETHPNISDDEALVWATNAYNYTEMKTGHSSTSLVFGHNNQLSGLLELAPTELEDVYLPPSIAENLMAREVAIANHYTIKMQQKFRHAILSKVRPTHDRKPVGSWVWFKRSNEKEWRGPGQITEAMKGQISVKVGKYYYPARHEDCFRLTKSQIEKLQLELELTEPDLINAVVKPVDDEKRTDTEILTEIIQETIPLSVQGSNSQEPEAGDGPVATNPSPGLNSQEPEAGNGPVATNPSPGFNCQEPEAGDSPVSTNPSPEDSEGESPGLSGPTSSLTPASNLNDADVQSIPPHSEHEPIRTLTDPPILTETTTRKSTRIRTIHNYAELAGIKSRTKATAKTFAYKKPTSGPPQDHCRTFEYHFRTLGTPQNPSSPIRTPQDPILQFY